MFSNRQMILPFRPKPTPVIHELGQCVLLGSCFADLMGHRFAYSGFSVLSNPFGTLYQPLSIAKMFERAKGACDYDAEDFVLRGELWHTWEQHSSMSDVDPQHLHLVIKERLDEMRSTLSNGATVFVSLGTSWVYRLKEKDLIVANCHKHPGQLFEKELLSVEDTVKAIQSVYNVIKHFNPSNQLVLSVSPVRHSRDGLPENNRSKGRLLEAVHTYIEQQEDVIYFPSYEFMIDHLRDYRFYATDMVHPSEQAADFIFDALVDLLTTDPVKMAVHEIQEYRKMEKHRPMFTDTLEYKNFQLNKEKKRIELMQKYPQVTF